ncbi:unnamed protein product, partial [Phaeothamnion confervicola]
GVIGAATPLPGIFRSVGGGGGGGGGGKGGGGGGKGDYEEDETGRKGLDSLLLRCANFVLCNLREADHDRPLGGIGGGGGGGGRGRGHGDVGFRTGQVRLLAQWCKTAALQQLHAHAQGALPCLMALSAFLAFATVQPPLAFTAERQRAVAECLPAVVDIARGAPGILSWLPDAQLTALIAAAAGAPEVHRQLAVAWEVCRRNCGGQLGELPGLALVGSGRMAGSSVGGMANHDVWSDGGGDGAGAGAGGVGGRGVPSTGGGLSGGGGGAGGWLGGHLKGEDQDLFAWADARPPPEAPWSAKPAELVAHSSLLARPVH